MTRPRPAAWEVPLGVGGERGGELPADSIEAAMPGLAQPGGGLCPAEGLLDALSDDLADLVSGMAGRSSAISGFVLNVTSSGTPAFFRRAGSAAQSFGR